MSLDGVKKIKSSDKKRGRLTLKYIQTSVCACAVLINLLKRITVQIEGSFIQISII